eukprot:TRINITY_DN7904_c0_g1_i1.p1 TRINITY_DN7904_c0_g1~~TRINITY_DN7904_c0_g1_i1.p1  ORF type:complete len:184 (+),score=31.34 TRINITY_DN7904_c0_g1_i1:171-722(+)
MTEERVRGERLTTEEPTPFPSDQNEEKEESSTKLCDFCFSEVPLLARRCRFCQGDLSMKETKAEFGFTVERETCEFSEKGFKKKVSRARIIVQDRNLRHCINLFLPSEVRIFDSYPKIDVEKLIMIYPPLKKYLQKNIPESKSLVEFLEKEYQVQGSQFEKMIAEKKISYERLNYIFLLKYLL